MYTQDVPRTYDEVFRQYRPLMAYLVREGGILEDRADDALMDIFTRFMERDMLSQYQEDKAKFSTYLTSFFKKSLRHQRDLQARERTRFTLLDIESADAADYLNGEEFYDLWFGALETLLYAELSDLNRETFRHVRELMDTEGVSAKALQKRLGIAQAQSYRRLKSLQSQTVEILNKAAA